MNICRYQINASELCVYTLLGRIHIHTFLLVYESSKVMV